MVLLGVDIEREPSVGRFLDTLVRGRAPLPGTQELVVGAEMARHLEVDVGDEKVVSGRTLRNDDGGLAFPRRRETGPYPQARSCR